MRSLKLIFVVTTNFFEMRRCFFCVFLLCCAIVNKGVAQATGQAANANAKTSTQLYVGPVIGGSLSKIYFFEEQFRYKSLLAPGFDAGIMASLKVNKNFRLNGQLIYSQRSKTIVGTDDPRVDNSYKLKGVMSYIEIPIFYALEFKNLKGNQTSQGGKQKAYDWYVGAGPVITYWLGTKGTLRSSNLHEIQVDHFDYVGVFSNNVSGVEASGKEVIPDANRLQFGINITAGLAFEPVGFHRIMASVHLNLMQTFMGKSDATFPASTPSAGTNLDDIDVMKARNNSIRFSVGYLFDTKVETRKKGKSNIPSRAVQRKRRR